VMPTHSLSWVNAATKQVLLHRDDGAENVSLDIMISNPWPFSTNEIANRYLDIVKLDEGGASHFVNMIRQQLAAENIPLALTPELSIFFRLTTAEFRAIMNIDIPFIGRRSTKIADLGTSRQFAIAFGT
jgi:hypothetical protein